METDQEFYEEICSSIGHVGEDEFDLNVESGGTLCVLNPDKLEPPKPGDRVKFWGKGFGFPVRGVQCGDRTYFYQTAEQFDAAMQKIIDDEKKERREKFEATKDKYLADIASLPEPFQQRIKGFQARKSDWDFEFGPYELFCCLEAVKISAVCKTGDDLQKFHDGSTAYQKLCVPGLDYDNHSVNTFGVSCKLAHIYNERPDLLHRFHGALCPRFHGALCPLVGCQDYGCWCTGEEARIEREKLEANHG